MTGQGSSPHPASLFERRLWYACAGAAGRSVVGRGGAGRGPGARRRPRRRLGAPHGRGAPLSGPEQEPKVCSGAEGLPWWEVVGRYSPNFNFGTAPPPFRAPKIRARLRPGARAPVLRRLLPCASRRAPERRPAGRDAGRVHGRLGVARGDARPLFSPRRGDCVRQPARLGVSRHYVSDVMRRFEESGSVATHQGVATLPLSPPPTASASPRRRTASSCATSWARLARNCVTTTPPSSWRMAWWSRTALSAAPCGGSASPGSGSARSRSAASDCAPRGGCWSGWGGRAGRPHKFKSLGHRGRNCFSPTATQSKQPTVKEPRLAHMRIALSSHTRHSAGHSLREGLRSDAQRHIFSGPLASW